MFIHMSVQDKIGLTSSKYDQTLLVICSVVLSISLDTCQIKVVQVLLKKCQTSDLFQVLFIEVLPYLLH